MNTCPVAWSTKIVPLVSFSRFLFFPYVCASRQGTYEIYWSRETRSPGLRSLRTRECIFLGLGIVLYVLDPWVEALAKQQAAQSGGLQDGVPMGVQVALLPILLQEFLLRCWYILILLIDQRQVAGEWVRRNILELQIHSTVIDTRVHRPPAAVPSAYCCRVDSWVLVHSRQQ
jgi:hypothetical protein